MGKPCAREAIEKMEACLSRSIPNSDRKWRLHIAGKMLAALSELEGCNFIDPDTGLSLGTYRTEQPA